LIGSGRPFLAMKRWCGRTKSASPPRSCHWMQRSDQRLGRLPDVPLVPRLVGQIVKPKIPAALGGTVAYTGEFKGFLCESLKRLGSVGLF
jgi:hypothetical protein